MPCLLSVSMVNNGAMTDPIMNAAITLTATKLDYASIAAARSMTGLRLVLGQYTIPGPWREACKSLFYVKGIPYTAVVTGDAGVSDLQMGMHGTQSELQAWTGQSSQPVAIWNDERPRASWIDQLNLAERLQPEPPLVPTAIDQRILMVGLINEIAGEYGLGWLKRVLTVHGHLRADESVGDSQKFFAFMGQKYGYTPAIASAAPARIATILAQLQAQLSAQAGRRSRYLLGTQLSAVDIYWATFCGFFAPLPPALCPMASAFRGGLLSCFEQRIHGTRKDSVILRSRGVPRAGPQSRRSLWRGCPGHPAPSAPSP